MNEILEAILEIRQRFVEALAELDSIIAEVKLRQAGINEIPVTELGNGWRIVDGELLYSAAWLDDSARAAKDWLDSRDAA